jgi:hypothetical protein
MSVAGDELGVRGEGEGRERVACVVVVLWRSDGGELEGGDWRLGCIVLY